MLGISDGIALFLRMRFVSVTFPTQPGHEVHPQRIQLLSPYRIHDDARLLPLLHPHVAVLHLIEPPVERRVVLLFDIAVPELGRCLPELFDAPRPLLVAPELVGIPAFAEPFVGRNGRLISLIFHVTAPPNAAVVVLIVRSSFLLLMIFSSRISTRRGVPDEKVDSKIRELGYPRRIDLIPIPCFDLEQHLPPPVPRILQPLIERGVVLGRNASVAKLSLRPAQLLHPLLPPQFVLERPRLLCLLVLGFL
mmetsp:Transcript_10471/g.30807  ORF Transcript_10471/g.30807 Transcript_10471/m.30807 type:complete len:250 (-) Transcript_10471:1352-2101(-)